MDAVGIVDAIIKTALLAADAVIKLFDEIKDVKAAEQQFTKSTVDKLAQMYPGKNIMMVHSAHDANFVNSAQTHVELKLVLSFTQGYDVYVFDSGTFTLKGDRGFENWCFIGNYNWDSVHNGNFVSFSKIPSK